MDTNGHGSLVNKKNIVPMLCGLIDSVSVSLNAATPEDYIRRCRPQEGKEAYQAMLNFTREAIKCIPEVQMTVLDFLEKDEIEQCRAIAKNIGAKFRVRKYIAGR